MKTDIEVIPYGEISSELTKDRWRRTSRHVRISNHRHIAKESAQRVFITYSYDLDDSFVEMFRNRSTQESRLLIFNEGISTDHLLSKVLDLQIRKPERCYVIESKVGSGRTYAFLRILHRLFSTFESSQERDRVFDATIENDSLRVVSPAFVRMEVPICKIPQFKNAKQAEVQNFEIDEDGAFVYWPDLDVHLGWTQLQELIDPQAALKASQKSQEFNKRYGRAIQKLREAAGLKRSDIPGLSEKQLGRIEKGECRLTSHAIETLSKSHKLHPNDYMKKLAQTLD